MIKILQRIKKAYNLETDAEVAEFLGIKPSTLSMQKNRGRLNIQRIIAECDDLNKNWLLDGVGPMRKVTLGDNVIHIPIYSSLVMANQKPNFQESTKAGNLVTDTIDGPYQFPSSDKVIGYIVNGDSMTSTLKENDIAIIELNSSVTNGTIFLISFENQLMFSHLKKTNGAYIASREDGDQPLLEIKSSNHIIGKLIWVMRPA